MHFDEESEENAELWGRQSFTVNNYYVLIDVIRINLEIRKTIYEDIHHKFGFLRKFIGIKNDKIRLKVNRLFKNIVLVWIKLFISVCIWLAKFLTNNKVESMKKKKRNNDPKQKQCWNF